MAYREHYHFEPLKITAHLRTNVVGDQWLPLDGVLLYAACREQLGPQVIAVPGGAETPIGASTLPLDIIHPGRRQWYYACSWAQPQPWWAAEGTDHWNKRFDLGFADLVDFGGKKGRILIGEGAYKAYHMPLFYRAALRIEWYCRGDRTEIAALLAAMTHLGKKTDQGWGRVARWDVEPWPEDWSVWRAGRLTRAVPPNDVTGARDLLLYGIRPPYYRSNNQMLLVMPG